MGADGITLFTWGYWGWGSATKQFVEGADAVESARGFAPPLFVDVRLKRNGQAKGFHNEAFATLLGRDRYRWMSKLGNAGIEDRTLRIAEPAAAAELLQLGLDAHARKQRVVFFCACEVPVPGDPPGCHRVEVARLVGEEAARQGRAVEIVEWPGGDPSANTVHVAAKVFKQVWAGDRQNVPLQTDASGLASIAGMPWGSTLEVSCEDEWTPVLSGPANFAHGNWQLPLFWPEAFDDHDPIDLAAAAQAFRRERGYESRRFGPTSTAKQTRTKAGSARKRQPA